MSTIPIPSETPLPSLPIGWHLLTAAAVEDGELALLAVDVDLAHEWRRGPDLQVLGNPWEVAKRAQAKIWSFDGDTLTDGPSFPLERLHPVIDRFVDGRWLVVACRTDSTPNARVLAPDGTCQARIMLGDGIEHVGVDRNGDIWVGWFDEGIFGNDEWCMPGEAWPPSSRGMARFTAGGHYRPLSDLPERAGMIADCYALTIADEGVWACPYTDFPLLHMSAHGPVRWWSNTVAGAKALAVSKGRVLLAGGYGEKANQLVLMALDGEGDGEPARTLAKGTLPLVRHVPQPGEPAHLAEHHPWAYPDLLAGRGDTIHLVQDETWYRWRL